MLASFADLSLPNIIIICGILAFVAERIAEALGWVRPANVLRIENTDLIRRNQQLEEAVERHTKSLENQSHEIRELKAQVAELKARDQASVLVALQTAQDAAISRYNQVLLHQDAATKILSDIRDILSNGRST